MPQEQTGPPGKKVRVFTQAIEGKLFKSIKKAFAPSLEIIPVTDRRDADLVISRQHSTQPALVPTIFILPPKKLRWHKGDNPPHVRFCDEKDFSAMAKHTQELIAA